jgi:Ribbon-helix-helix protein, copG family.
MTSGTVSVRLSGEVLQQLERLAQERNLKVSDLVREFITDGLSGRGEPKVQTAVIEQLNCLTDILSAVMHETVGARYFSELALSYAADMESLIREKQVLDKDAKERLMAQFDESAQERIGQAWQRILSRQINLECS